MRKFQVAAGACTPKSWEPFVVFFLQHFSVEWASQLMGIYFTSLAPCNSWLMLMQRKSFYNSWLMLMQRNSFQDEMSSVLK